jgi:Holliday junction resolvasome RuvABC endonuclease subunit
MITALISVGRNSANWTPASANWIQLADVCQLDFHNDQSLRVQSAMLAVGRPANLPTDASHCFDMGSTPNPDGGDSSPFQGERKTPFPLPRPEKGGSRSGMGDRPEGVRILALDLGTRTGWALLAVDQIITSGSETFKPGRFEGGGMRFLRFKRWLTEIKQSADGLDAVYFEEVRRHAGVDAAHAYGGFMAHMTAWCEHHEIPYQGVPVGTIKKHATGKGNASKAEMIAAMRARGFRPVDDNEADALALLVWAMAQEVSA